VTRAFDTEVDVDDDDADVNEYSSSACSERKTSLRLVRVGPDVIDDAFGGSSLST
jgi:hypothetical protein